MSTRYAQSELWLNRAQTVIPTGSQTFSKSPTQFPWGVSPYFAEKAEGATLWDIDGNTYTDFINALAAVTLGYNNPDVTKSVKEQIEKGTIFSLNNRLEAEVAEMICDMVPCAEQVRFSKNGSDATSAAIRLARAYTGRDKIACCGYHGWHDWYIATTSRNTGIPETVQSLSLTFTYNDIQSLEKCFTEHPGQIAAVILEPMNVQFPTHHFLEDIRALCTREGALLIFDETITGFRLSNGGAQALFNITPDLACFGKGLANGYPLSAVTGHKDIMQYMEKIFFSGTFGGECLSLAAARSVLTQLKEKPILKQMAELGKSLVQQVCRLLETYHLQEHIKIQGHPAWSFLIMQDYYGLDVFELKTFYMQECFANGILGLGTHNLSHAHTAEHIDQLCTVYTALFEKLCEFKRHGDKSKLLHCDPIRPLFKVRG